MARFIGSAISTGAGWIIMHTSQSSNDPFSTMVTFPPPPSSAGVPRTITSPFTSDELSNAALIPRKWSIYEHLIHILGIFSVGIRYLKSKEREIGGCPRVRGAKIKTAKTIKTLIAIGCRLDRDVWRLKGDISPQRYYSVWRTLFITSRHYTWFKKLFHYLKTLLKYLTIFVSSRIFFESLLKTDDTQK